MLGCKTKQFLLGGRQTQKGFTLIEALVCLIVLAILSGFAFPAMQRLLVSNRVATSTNELISGFNLARIEAIKNSRGSGICASADGESCSGDWNDGFLVWGDLNSNGELDSTETVLRVAEGAKDTSVSSSTTTVLFDYKGRRRTKEDISITLTPEKCSGNLQRTFEVQPMGRLNVLREECS